MRDARLFLHPNILLIGLIKRHATTPAQLSAAGVSVGTIASPPPTSSLVINAWALVPARPSVVAH
jgi:hypothetical protein